MKRSSSSPIKEVLEEETSMREGILTVLRDLDRESPTAAKSSPSIRRTLSADMSSKKWLAQNGFSLTPPPTVITKDNSSSADAFVYPNNNIRKGEEESNPTSQDDVWRSIQSRRDSKIAKEPEPIWDSILADNRQATNKENKLLQPRKRSLSEKSLEICTESLGSETGSDCNPSPYGSSSEFSYAADDDDGDYQEREKIITTTTQDPDFSENPEFVPVKYKIAPIKPFPPTIRSISSVDSSLQMRSRRENGRLVLDAVSTPPRNRFVAQRGNGRLVLAVMDQNPGNEIIAKSNPVMMKKRNKKNTRWNDRAVGEEEEEIIAQSSLPPLPRVSRMIPKPQATSEGSVSPRVIVNKHPKPLVLRNHNYYSDGSDKRVVSRGSGEVESFAAYLKGCKEAKRSLLVREPYCIATS